MSSGFIKSALQSLQNCSSSNKAFVKRKPSMLYSLFFKKRSFPVRWSVFEVRLLVPLTWGKQIEIVTVRCGHKCSDWKKQKTKGKPFYSYTLISVYKISKLQTLKPTEQNTGAHWHLQDIGKQRQQTLWLQIGKRGLYTDWPITNKNKNRKERNAHEHN